MNAVLQVNKVQDYCREQVDKSMAFDNIFFQELSNGQMSLDEFKQTQKQFYYAVSFFSRPMTALMARFPNPGSRLSILENVVEEHGSFNKSSFHESTFRDFLVSLGVDIKELDVLELWPEVRAFNSTLMTACVFDEAEVGVSCLGAIEYMFATISANIGQSVVKRDWCTGETLKHYKLHSELDVQHALDFFNIVEPLWGEEDKNYLIRQGIDMGIYIFDRLYKDLSARAKKLL